MTPDQAAALRAHVELVDRYRINRAQEELRLREPFLSRLQAGGAKVFGHRQLADEDAKELRDINQQIADGLAAFDAAQRPREPVDTPAGIVEFISFQEGLRATIRTQMRDREAYDSKKAGETYLAARERALKFTRFDPGLPARLPFMTNPFAGVQDIWTWAETAQSVSSSPLAAAPSRRPAEEWSPPMSKAAMRDRLNLNRRSFDTFLKGRELKKHGRQLWQLRMDSLDPSTRRRLSERLKK